MLLNRIDEKNKKLFLQLVKKTMEADGFVSEKEEEIYKNFCTELGVVLIDEEPEISELSYESIIKELGENCSSFNRRLIAFEIITISTKSNKLIYLKVSGE